MAELKKRKMLLINQTDSISDKISNLNNQVNLENTKIKNYLLKIYNNFDYPYVGIQNNISITSLINKGFSVVYNKTYGHITTSSEVDAIRSSCKPSTVLCIGGGEYDNLLVVSCGLCEVVFRNTSANQPNLHNEAYWYYTHDKSIGYAPISNINQANCDSNESSDNKRLCWHFTGGAGGWRIGSIVGLNDDTRFTKTIFKRDNSTIFSD